MSVSIALVPVALILRVTMGKDRFEAWVRSQQVRISTDIRSGLDLTRAVKKAGYDCEAFGPMFKSHLPDGSFCFWENASAGWELVFSINHDSKILHTLREAVERSAGRVVFNPDFNQQHATQSHWPTNFSDHAALMQTLVDLEAEPTETTRGEIVCKLGGVRVRFFKSGEAPFSVEIKNSSDLAPVFPYLVEIEDEYRRTVQASVYQKVRRTACDYGFTLESEEVLEDKSVVLTLRIT